MKVLLVTNMYPTETNPFYGIFVREQVESLREENVIIDVFFINGQKNRFNYLASIIALIKKIRRQKYDIIHAHHTYCVYPIKFATAVTGVKTPLILTFHEGEVHQQNGASEKNIDLIKQLVFSKRLKRIALKKVDLVIAVQAEMLKQLNFNGRSIVLPCGVNSEMFRPLGRIKCREKLGLPLDKKIIFFPASPDNKQKGFDILKESIWYLNRPDLQLIAGGNLLHSDMPYYMNAADVVVQLSAFEASPSVLKEALAVNVPLIFTNTGDAKMITGNAEGCFLVDRRPEAVSQKLDQALGFQGTCDGRDRIFEINLTLKRVSQKIVSVYKELLRAGDMKKVCIVRHGHYPFDIRVRKEALALAEKGYHVDIICLRQDFEKKREVNHGVNIYRIPIKHRREGISRYIYEYTSFFCLATIKLWSLYFRHKYDFIQVNTLPDFLVFVTILPKLLGAKVCLDLHEPTPELFGTLFGHDRKLLIRFVRFLEKISILYADHSITVSEQMKKNYIKQRYPASKIDVVLNVPNLEFNVDRYKNNSQRNDNKFLLLIHGAMLKRCGQDVAIRAIDIVKEEVPNVQLNILGYGEYEPQLKRLVSELGLENYVHFFGFIPFLDMIKMIAQSDLGIVPTDKNAYSDLVHTNKMFEFIAMKKPVIISRTRAVEEFFGSNDACLKYFKSGDVNKLANSIIELYNSPEKREQMASNAFTKFESVSWEKTKEDYCQMYENL